MVEIPRLPNGEQHAVCLTCLARTIIEQKVYCDESKIFRRPKLCPLPAKMPQSINPYSLLRDKLRNNKP